MAGKRAVKLKSIYDVSRLLSKTINQVLRDEMPGEKAGKIGYLSNILIRALEQSQLEKRIEALERKISMEGMK